ncbi:nicotinate phosphoribosyltransferase [Mycoplasma bradburyae]|uniref:Nicotinamide phosphoribosyltransferase n=1 Tax=Mycoplasma bradburyae TaxID=2963128 RepID=A0AAW6HNP1_9MOLU|nr:nicotinate phosphoribosyltransferase [Mycoplasma bradburyae]MDC4183042.1 nicotinate phosphoribosyltransferase [Mycoplasma bradburyae]UTS70720.1 nicotinate phosphoribosyltransferase [Mycoplasma bradburyae]
MLKHEKNVLVSDEINEHLVNLIPVDAYKLCHRLMYPKNTTNLFSTLTARKTSLKNITTHAWNAELTTKVVCDIIDRFVYSLIEMYNEKDDKIKNLIRNKLYSVFSNKEFSDDFTKALIDVSKYANEHKRLPIIISVRKSDQYINFNEPLLTICGEEGINKKYVWLINYFETIILQNIWQYQTSLTIAREFYDLCSKYAVKTADFDDFVKYQCHDFSMRGMSSFKSSIYSANAHLQYFNGSDSILGGNNAESVIASEHSVMCADGEEQEAQTYERLLDIFKDGILSLVVDSWDIWNVLDNILPSYKEKILSRKGKLVVRPDSGDPIEVICGKNYDPNDKSTWGTIHYLDHHFGSKINSKGYRELNEKVGIIYGDAITLARSEMILQELEKQKYSSNNIVFGVGATTYQSSTRDTLGFVIKLTAIEKEINGKTEWFNIKKAPKTDQSKESLTGRFFNENLVRIY